MPIRELDPAPHRAEKTRVFIAKIVFIVCSAMIQASFKLVPESHPARIFNDGLEAVEGRGVLRRALVPRPKLRHLNPERTGLFALLSWSAVNGVVFKGSHGPGDVIARVLMLTPLL